MTETIEAPAAVESDIEQLIRRVAGRIQPRYGQYVTVDDVVSELWLYATTDGYVTRAARKGDDQRVWLALHGAGRNYCETEKAHQSGYSLDDVAWYKPPALADLVPLALDPLFDGTGVQGEDGMPQAKSDGSDAANLLVQVLDVRAAIAAVGAPVGADDAYAEGLGRLAEWLGGAYPSAPGYGRSRRRVVSNASAVSLTRRNEGE